MKVFSSITDPDVAQLLQSGAIGVIPTDTVYGVVAVAKNQAAVERIYDVKGRDKAKACIMLVGSRPQITDTKNWQTIHWQLTEQYWPGPVSIILPTSELTPAYLHRGSNNQTLSYRVPDMPELQQLLRVTGVLASSSANPEGQVPATTLAEAQAYFGDSVDFYVDGGDYSGKQPSAIIRALGSQIEVVRGPLIEKA